MSKTKRTGKPKLATERPVDIPVKRFDPRRGGLERWFGPLEAAIMKIIWDNPDRKPIVKFVLRELQRYYGNGEIGYTTVMTTIVRLYEKGILQRKRQGLAYVYWATVPEEEFINFQVTAILRSLEDNEDFIPSKT